MNLGFMRRRRRAGFDYGPPNAARVYRGCNPSLLANRHDDRGVPDAAVQLVRGTAKLASSACRRKLPVVGSDLPGAGPCRRGGDYDDDVGTAHVATPEAARGGKLLRRPAPMLSRHQRRWAAARFDEPGALVAKACRLRGLRRVWFS